MLLLEVYSIKITPVDCYILLYNVYVAIDMATLV